MTTVRIPPTLRPDAEGEREVAAQGSTVREVLDEVGERFPRLGARIFENGNIAAFVNVYVGGEDIRTQDGLETPVADDSTVILLPAMAGGALASLATLRVPAPRAEPASGPPSTR
jgi:molybdopterin converting factor small subunit